MRNSAPDYSNLIRNVLNMSIMTIVVGLAIVILFVLFIKIY